METTAIPSETVVVGSRGRGGGRWPEDELARATEVMLEAMVESVPVVDAAGRVVGVITWSDVVARATGRFRDTR
jgi:CBS-domain-containing membrane protein